MIAVAGAWLLKNPLAGGLGIAAVVLGLALGVQTLRLSWTQSELATEKLAFANFKTDLAEESARVQREAAEASRQQAERLAHDFMAIQANASDVKAAINAAKSTGACERDPKYRATVDGVQRILDQGNTGR